MAEFDGKSIILTSLPNGEGCLRLKNSGDYLNFDMQVQLDGNKYGSQSILLRMDKGMENGTTVTIKNNELYIYETLGGNEETLFALDLNAFDGFVEKNSAPSISEPASRFLELTIANESLSVYIDKKEAAINVPVNVTNAGFVGIKSKSSAQITGQKTQPDNIYDGVFSNLVISENNGGRVLFENQLSLMESVIDKAKKTWSAITDWFIENMWREAYW